MTGDGGKKKASGGGGGNNGFKGLGLSEPIYRAIVRMGFRMPTPVQRKALPVVLTGADACVMARTGSGKTIAFLIPLLEKLIKTNVTINASTNARQSSCRAVIISPTRELSLQTLKVLNKLAHFTEFRAIGIHGGEGMEKQFDMLASKPDIIVATPGRLAHHLSEIPDFNLSNCLMCVLDEADRLMEMGFSSQIREIGRTMPEYCQKVMLSATMPKILVEFTKTGFCTDPQVVRLDQECSVSEDLRIAFLTCRSSEKDAALLHVMQQIQDDLEKNSALRTGLTIVFAATRHHVEYIQSLLEAVGISSTLIYGTLDQEARKSNLSAFRTGKKNVLVVTDVAARGIDCPLVDHVVHYNFPPDAKLFVHRSGRAARAGRIGFCWGLVDPEELPYMIDLHLFLGRHPTDSEAESTKLAYDLNEMTPEMVHYGSLPNSILTQQVENVQRLVDSELTGSIEAESLRSLTKVCANAMKQYRRTRPEASKDAVRRAKAIMEGARLETGERIGKAKIPTHPLLKAGEEKLFQSSKGENDNNLHSLDNFKDHQNFLEEIAAFRPKETVFEAFATGVGKDVGVASQVDRGRTTSTRKNSSVAALSAMKNMRRQMKTVRNKGDALVVAGSSAANKLNDGFGEIADHQVAELVDDPEEKISRDNVETGKMDKEAGTANVTSSIARKPKKFLSKAERRRQKKKGQSCSTDVEKAAIGKKESKKCLAGSDFKDPAFYIDNDIISNPEEAHRARQVEAALQPSAGLKGIIGSAYRLEEAMLDVVGDENEELVQKQRMMRWDKSKRKYVQTTVGSELSRDSKSKKIRLESGELKKTDKVKLGDLYAKWQKKTNRSVGRNGVFDDGPDSSTADFTSRRGSRKAKGRKGGKGDKIDTKSAVDIKKDRAKKHDTKIKNMKKNERKKVEQQQRGQNRKNGGMNAFTPKHKKGK